MTHRAVWLPVVAALLVVCGVDAQSQKAQTKPKTEKLTGYAEFRRSGMLVVDGQRVVVDSSTKLKGRGIASFDSIPLGYEIEAKGVRLEDGVFLAREIEAKDNGNGLFETDIRSATDEIEAQWLQDGRVFEEDDDGKKTVIGRIVTRGPHVERVQNIVRRVAPPYVDANNLRVHVVDTKDWNAMAMGNGAIWVFTGLLKDMDDDEAAIVIGHELAHFTHEHSRREFKRAFWMQLIALGALAATEVSTDDDKKKIAVAVGALAVAMTYQNGYSRQLEDQADRVGLRYAYEGGYDVSKGPRLWMRFKEKYGEANGVMNFFLGEHSQASARVRNLEREIAFNYSGQDR